MQLDHFNITAPRDQLLRVRDFYIQVLGLTEGERPNFKSNGFWLYGNGKPIVHLMEGEVSEKQPAKPYLDHVAFHTDDLQPIKERLDSMGIACRQMDVPGRNLRPLVFFDPVGIKVEVNALV
ncbi:VOC family protein [Microbulbifer echini]|uniref:VOC family protein n=1 Tax=Microbulbifer echini TaxID=1529067 RepID=A0ABV4NSD6_9GAMM|nr:VOC family protein [uncultured Microbulbifer sp.]